MAKLVSKISGLFKSKPTDVFPPDRPYLDYEPDEGSYADAPEQNPADAPPEGSYADVPEMYKADAPELRAHQKVQRASNAEDLFLVQLNEGRYWFPLPEDSTHCLEIFQLLYALSKEVESFVQNCCGEAWIQAAMMLSNVSEHISSIAFNLDSLIGDFSKSLTLTEVDRAFKSEVERVKEKTSLDQEKLLAKLNTLLQTNYPTSTEYQLAVLLLERVESSRQNLTCDSPEISQSSLSETVSRSLEQMESLGKGSCAIVYRAMWMGVEVAKKTFYAPNFPDFEKEVSILVGLSHSYITSILCYAKDKRECSIVMELMDEDLFDLIQRRLRSNNSDDFPFGILEAFDIMLQIGEGMHYLHRMRIVHRDLKARNILVRHMKSTRLEMDYVIAKVADFGLSRTKERSMTYSNQTLNIGTTRWMAPEMIKSCNAESEAESFDDDAMVKRYPFKCDVYSYAMICYEILSGDMPFSSTSSLSDVKKMVLAGERPSLPCKYPLFLRLLIVRCWSPDTSKRPDFGEICAELRHMKYLLMIPSPVDVVSPALNRPMQQEISGSMPLGFKRRYLHVEWLVGLDFGTTHSGFAYANVSDQDQIFLHYDYPCRISVKPHCKTLTALYYKLAGPGTLQCASWGYIAHLDYLAANRSLQTARESFYLPNFELLSINDLNDPSLAASLPHPLTVNTIITDYLKHIGEYALTVIKHHWHGQGRYSRESVQWCVAVPSSWDNAEQRIKECMVNAGLVSAEGVMESVKVVQESEVTSFECLQILRPYALRDSSLHLRDRILIADVGSRAVDIVVQEVVENGNDFKLQDLTEHSGGLCGWTSVDESFMEFLSRKIECLDSFLISDMPSYRWRLLKDWEYIKCDFGHEMMRNTETVEICLHGKLARKWEAYEEIQGVYPRSPSYSEIELTEQDLKSIFDPVVDEILALIAKQLVRVEGIKVMFVVGEFSASPYLMQRIRARFSDAFTRSVSELLFANHIISPFNPASHILRGAVGLALS